MHLFTIKTSKKTRVFDLNIGGFFGAGLYYSYKRTKIDSDRRVIMRTFSIMIPLMMLECNVYRK